MYKRGSKYQPTDGQLLPSISIMSNGNRCLPKLERTESMEWFEPPKKKDKLVPLLRGARNVLTRAQFALSSYEWKIEKGVIRHGIFEQHVKISQLRDAVKEAQYWFDLINGT